MPMALLHQVYLTSVPLCCVVRSRAFAMSSAASLTLPVSPAFVRAPHVDPQVLLGMSESDLQQLAANFGQQKYRGKQLHHLLYKAKVMGIHAFSHLPQAFRNELQEAGWTVERSSVYQALTAADDPVKVLAIEDIFKRRVSNVVFMGMGVPMLNLKSVLDAHRCLNKVLAFAAALECRKITVSIRQTRGLDARAACGQLKNEFQKTHVLATAEMLIIFSSNATQTTNLTPL